MGASLGLTQEDTPEWTWIGAVLLIDVAHVYATGFRVYFDRDELSRRPWLYGLTPLLAFLVGLAIYSESPLWFWRILAYMAVFHFVRQQYGWVALYRSRGKETGRIGYWIDASAIYLATLYPLIYWHAHLPNDARCLSEASCDYPLAFGAQLANKRCSTSECAILAADLHGEPCNGGQQDIRIASRTGGID